METAEAEIERMRADDLRPGTVTPGIARLRAFDRPGVLVVQSRIGPRAVSDWHHHGVRTLYGFLAHGELRFDYGPSGSRAVRFSVGDFFRVAPGSIHRDVNPSAVDEARVIAFLVGDGPPIVNVQGPA